MKPIVIDASGRGGAHRRHHRGRALRTLLPVDAVPWAPETFYVEVGTVLRRRDLKAILTPSQKAKRSAISPPGRCASRRCVPCSPTRGDITFADPTYVTLAEHLDAPLLTEDHKLASAPSLPVQLLRLPPSP